jgi:hypothetical protein
MIDITSRTDYIAIWPSCIKFSVSFGASFGPMWILLFFCFCRNCFFDSVEKDRRHNCKTPFAIEYAIVLRQKQKNITLFFCILSFVVEMNSRKLHIYTIAYLFFCILQLCSCVIVR